MPAQCCRQNRAVEFRKFVIWLGIILRVFRVSGKQD
jgi:hypothetical protein